MPQLFKIGSYWVYFWSNEGLPLEPIHVHIAQGQPAPDATKIWITMSGKCLKCHNKSQISDHTLRNIMRIIELRTDYIQKCWGEHFGDISYYC